MGFVNSPGQSVLTNALIVFTAVAVSSVVWSYVELGAFVGPIFVVRDGLSPLDSVVAALAFLPRNGSRLMAVGIWNNTLRGLSATVITVVASVTVAMHTALPGWAVALLFLLETLLYLVVSDFLLRCVWPPTARLRSAS